MNARDVAQSVLVSLSGSFQTAPNFWLNPRQRRQLPGRRAVAAISRDSLQDLLNTPVNDPGTPTRRSC